jgi:hypothetical protein
MLLYILLLHTLHCTKQGGTEHFSRSYNVGGYLTKTRVACLCIVPRTNDRLFIAGFDNGQVSVTVTSVTVTKVTDSACIEARTSRDYSNRMPSQR